MALFDSADQTLSVVVKARDEASAVLTKVDKSVKQTSKGMETATKAAKIAAAGFLAVGTAAVAFGTMAVKAAGEAQAEMAKFNATLATMGPKGQAAKAGILAAANAAVKLGFDDEEAANSIANFFQRTGDLNQALKLNAIAMDISRAKGTSLADSSRMISLVMSGNARALKEYGIEIDDSLTPLQALDVLQQKVAGQAQAFAGTFQGKLAALNVEFQNLLETLGDALLPVLTRVLGTLSDLINAFPRIVQNVKAFFETIEENTGIGETFRELWEVISLNIQTQLLPALRDLWTALQPLMPYIKAFGEILGAAFVGAILLTASTLTILTNILVGVLTVATKLATFISNVLGAAIDYIRGLFEGWLSVMQKVIDLVGKLSFNIASGLAGAVKSVGKLVGFEHGGTVPGPVGTPVPIMAHGGERVIPASQSGSGAGPIVLNFHFNDAVAGDDGIKRIITQTVAQLNRTAGLAAFGGR